VYSFVENLFLTSSWKINFFSHLLSVFLMLASQRIETVIDFSGEPQTVDEVPTKRGAAPTLIEWTILSWVGGEY
jgi:transient receptor potential cation channel subfamily C